MPFHDALVQFVRDSMETDTDPRSASLPDEVEEEDGEFMVALTELLTVTDSVLLMLLLYVVILQRCRFRYLFCDSGRPGTHGQFLQLFKAAENGPYNRHIFHINYSEDSVREHRKA